MTARKTPVRRTKTPGSLKAGRAVVAREPRSLVEITSVPEGDEPEPIPVFAIDGETYTMPAVISASFALEVLDRMRTDGEMAVTGWMLEEVLGTEAYEALKGCKGLNTDQLKAIMDHVSEHVMGALEGTSGN
jgi:hypothetical protein